jgi:hypothetical protein
MEKDNTIIWKPIYGFEKYLISNNGDIYSTKTKKIMKYEKTNKRYGRIKFYENKKRNWFVLRKLVADAFVPNPHKYYFIKHINGDKTDTRACNLEWVKSLNPNTGKKKVKKSSKKKCFKYIEIYSDKFILDFD